MLLSLFRDKWVLEKPPVIHALMAPSLFQAHLHGCSLDPSTPLWVFREQTGNREAPDLTQLRSLPALEPAPHYPDFVPGMECVLYAPGSISKVTDMIWMQKFLIEYKSAAVITPMRSWYTALAIYFGKTVCLFSQDCWIQSVLFVCFVYLLFQAVISTLLCSVNPIKFSTSNASIFTFQSLWVSMYDFYFTSVLLV